VRHLLRNVLCDVPVFDDLAVLEPEDIHDGAAERAGLAHRMDMQDDIVAVRECFFDYSLCEFGNLPRRKFTKVLKPSMPSGAPGLCWMYFGP